MLLPASAGQRDLQVDVANHNKPYPGIEDVFASACIAKMINRAIPAKLL